MVIQLKVVDFKGHGEIIDICDDVAQFQKIKVEQAKRIIQSKLQISVEIRLVFRTFTLEESTFLVSHKVQHLSTIRCLPLLPGGR